jgi:hypothetical protein
MTQRPISTLPITAIGECEGSLEEKGRDGPCDYPIRLRARDQEVHPKPKIAEDMWDTLQ